MEITFGIQPNCSECALVVYSDKINKKQRKFFEDYFQGKNIEYTLTPLGNIAVETSYDTNVVFKDDLWKLRDSILEVAGFEKLEIEEDKHFKLIRDESWDDMLEEKRI